MSLERPVDLIRVPEPSFQDGPPTSGILVTLDGTVLELFKNVHSVTAAAAERMLLAAAVV